MNALTLQLYPSLLRHATYLLMGTTASMTMQPADLLHAAVAKLCRLPPVAIADHPAMFSGLVCQVMQRTLINEHRRNGAARRLPAALAVSLEEAGEIPAPDSGFVAAEEVHLALAALAIEDPDGARVVRGLFLEDKTTRELAAELKVSAATVSRRWTAAAAWLRQALQAA